MNRSALASALPIPLDAALLREADAFAAAPEAVIDRLRAEAQIETAPKDKILYLSGERATHAFVVRHGWVKIFRETLDGSEAILDILPKGSLFGEAALFGDGTHGASAQVVEDAELLRLPLPVLRAELARDSGFAFSLMGWMARQSTRQARETEHRDLQNAPQRIGCFLLRLIPPGVNSGPVALNLPYDKGLVAGRLGMQPETFSRALQKLREMVGMKITGARIEIDEAAQLARYACSACTYNFPCSDGASPQKR